MLKLAIAMTEKTDKNEIKSNSGEQKTAVKKKNVFFESIKIILLILLFAALIVFTIFGKKIFKNSFGKKVVKEEVIQEKAPNNEITMMFQEISLLQSQVEKNSARMRELEMDIMSLEKKIENIDINSQRVELIRLILTIQADAENGINYTKDLNRFNILTKNNTNIASNIAILEKYKNSIITNKIIKSNFGVELAGFVKQYNVLKSSNNGLVSKFLSNFVIVRKTNDAEQNTPDYTINAVENAINSENYGEALLNLNKNSEYAKYFPKTISNLNSYLELNNSIDEIIKYLVNQ